MDVIDYDCVFRLAQQLDACGVALRTHSIEVWSAPALSEIRMFSSLIRQHRSGGFGLGAPAQQSS